MTLRSAAAALLAVAVLTTPAVHAQENMGNDSNEDSYKFLLAQLKGGDTQINYEALRFAFATTSEYNPFGNEPRELIQSIFTALDSKRFAESLKLARQLLKDFYLSGDAHIAAAMSLEALGESQEAAYHHAVARGLFDSICAGTDGRSPESPCRVISVAEEYFYLGVAGLETKNQGLTTCKTGPCDHMSVRDELTGDEFSLYFDISTKMNAMSGLFGTDD